MSAKVRRLLVSRAHGCFRGSGGCGRAVIGDEVADGDIDLMSHGRNCRHRTSCYRACDALVIERPEILSCTAAPPDDDRVGPAPA